MNDKGIRALGSRIVQHEPEYSLCTGCSTCEIVCSLTHDGLVSPSCRRIFVNRGTRSMIHEILSCQHCSDHPCYMKCPKRDSAMRIDENGIVYINEEDCIGCGICVKACVFDPPRINIVKSKDKDKRKAKKCDLCRSKPEGPACIQWCPVRCISLGPANEPEPAMTSGGGEI